jgi:hypothetical protein
MPPFKMKLQVWRDVRGVCVLYTYKKRKITIQPLAIIAKGGGEGLSNFQISHASGRGGSAALPLKSVQQRDGGYEGRPQQCPSHPWQGPGPSIPCILLGGGNEAQEPSVGQVAGPAPDEVALWLDPCSAAPSLAALPGLYKRLSN